MNGDLFGQKTIAEELKVLDRFSNRFLGFSWAQLCKEIEETDMETIEDDVVGLPNISHLMRGDLAHDVKLSTKICHQSKVLNSKFYDLFQGIRKSRDNNAAFNSALKFGDPDDDRRNEIRDYVKAYDDYVSKHLLPRLSAELTSYAKKQFVGYLDTPRFNSNVQFWKEWNDGNNRKRDAQKKKAMEDLKDKPK
ncbi:hypothetical protein CANARDRAFT_6101 [[Candida] arabinofermentans NRRL YB-2248]|uniref:Uncharacterized protein n=1 Tax=[Candida] arabinofermentans NRRL YB-2248 TaxID=983967 RepID=A0A1E4T741_9ASCO|nr:hypothetical protein CANARDRAFT_6101 [[Candida] arabinofermentans NRRL YB-2248]